MTPTLDVLTVVGARPNLVKLAPLHHALGRREGVRHRVLHTGQHYDVAMSFHFARDLGLPIPTWNLGLGGGSHAEQTGEMMIGIEKMLMTEERPDVVVVLGDVNSSLAGALAAAKLSVPVAHVEAGLRSGDRSMPEEINRMVIDRVSDLHLVSESIGLLNLEYEGVPTGSCHLVGNILADAVEGMGFPIGGKEHPPGVSKHEPYGVVTLHRPALVDDPSQLNPVLEALTTLANEIPLVLCVHPRLKARIPKGGIPGVRLMAPQPYRAFLGLLYRAELILTDSGGCQVEAAILGVPCVTLRDSTEHEITLRTGRNRLCGLHPDRILGEARLARTPGITLGALPESWDGRAASRIADLLLQRFGKPQQHRYEERDLS